MNWAADPTLRLIRHLFAETLTGLNPMAEDSRQESRIILLVTLGVIGLITSLGGILPFLFGLPRQVAIEYFWRAQSELLLKFSAMVGIFSVLRWEPMQQGLSRHRFFLSILSARRLFLASLTAQFLFVCLLSSALNLMSALSFTLFIPEKLGVFLPVFLAEYLLLYTLVAIFVFFLIQPIIFLLRLLHLGALRYLLLSYFTVIIVIPASLLHKLLRLKSIELIPGQKAMETIFKNMLSNHWGDFFIFLLLTTGALATYALLSALFMRRQLADIPAEGHHRLRSFFSRSLSRLLAVRPSLNRGVQVHLIQSILASRHLRTMVVILLSVMIGAFSAEILGLFLWETESLSIGVIRLGSTFYFMTILALSMGFYYINRQPVARRHAWVFQVADPHALYWESKKSLLLFMVMLGFAACLSLSPFLALWGGINFSLNHSLLGLTIWTLGAVWHSGSGTYIPFTATIEQDRILFKRLWLLYLIALYLVSAGLSALARHLANGQALWLLPLVLLIIGSALFFYNRGRKDLIALREPEYEATEDGVLVGFDSV
jgi:hypothetical protein